MSIVEKVARAIAASEGWSLPHDMTLPYAAGDQIGQTMAKARAAIEALRDAMPPTKTTEREEDKPHEHQADWYRPSECMLCGRRRDNPIHVRSGFGDGK